MKGTALTLGSGSLDCRHIIHAVGPRWRGGHANEEWDLSNCVESCFDEMRRLKLQSIAIPPISTGIFGYPVEKAVKVIVEAIVRRDKSRELPEKIILVDNSANSLSLRCFERELKLITSSSSAPTLQPAPVQRSALGMLACICNNRHHKLI